MALGCRADLAAADDSYYGREPAPGHSLPDHDLPSGHDFRGRPPHGWPAGFLQPLEREVGVWGCPRPAWLQPAPAKLSDTCPPPSPWPVAGTSPTPQGAEELTAQTDSGRWSGCPWKWDSDLQLCASHREAQPPPPAQPPNRSGLGQRPAASPVLPHPQLRTHERARHVPAGDGEAPALLSRPGSPRGSTAGPGTLPPFSPCATPSRHPLPPPATKPLLVLL